MVTTVAGARKSTRCCGAKLPPSEKAREQLGAKALDRRFSGSTLATFDVIIKMSVAITGGGCAEGATLDDGEQNRRGLLPIPRDPSQGKHRVQEAECPCATEDWSTKAEKFPPGKSIFEKRERRKNENP